LRRKFLFIFPLRCVWRFCYKRFNKPAPSNPEAYVFRS
jgi:hypothetical protein